MRTNAIPFLFLPGISLVGYGLAGWSGVTWGLDTWCVVVAIGTLIHMTRLILNRGDGDGDDDDDVERFVERTTSVMSDSAPA